MELWHQGKLLSNCPEKKIGNGFSLCPKGSPSYIVQSGKQSTKSLPEVIQKLVDDALSRDIHTIFHKLVLNINQGQQDCINKIGKYQRQFSACVEGILQDYYFLSGEIYACWILNYSVLLRHYMVITPLCTYWDESVGSDATLVYVNMIFV